jgi:hypothetical protein
MLALLPLASMTDLEHPEMHEKGLALLLTATLRYIPEQSAIVVLSTRCRETS